MALKDDLLGLGAKKEYGGGLWRGTAEVDDLYRRLEVGGSGTPKPEEVKVEEVKEEVKMRGGWKMRFLVGDTYTSSFSTEVSTAEGSEAEAPSSVDESSGEVKKGKKRKRDAETGEKNRSKKEKIDKKKSKVKEQVDTAGSKPASGISEVRRKKDKKRSKVDTATTEDQDGGALTASTSDRFPIASTKKEKKSKKDKKKRKTKSKEEKTAEPEKRTRKKDKSKTNGAATETALTSEFKSATSVSEPTIPIPNVARSEPMPRHMHRARFLAMKRASVMDPNALREILGVTG